MLQLPYKSTDLACPAAGESGRGAAAGTACPAAAEVGAEPGGRPDAAEPAATGAGEAGKAGAAEESAPPLRPADPRLADGGPREKSVLVSPHGPQVGQQPALGNGQLLQCHVAPGPPQKRLDETEIDQRKCRIGVGARELPDERIGKTDQQLTRRGKPPAKLEVDRVVQYASRPAGP